jgi:RNA polymerase sigma-70 factor (family 1)
VQIAEQHIAETLLVPSEQAFEQLFRDYYPRLCAFALTLLHNKEEAEEIVQTMFCRLWEQRDSIDVTTSVQAYLFRAVRNASLNQIKKTQIRDAYKVMNLDTINSNPEFQPDRITQSELSKRLEKAISGLPEQCRLIFKMSRFEELKYREIADNLGISIKTVENQMGKALKILRGEMRDFITILVAFIFFNH